MNRIRYRRLNIPGVVVNYLLNAPFTTDLLLLKGTGSFTFARTSTATNIDFEGVIKTVKSGAIRIDGARYVENLITKSEDFSNVSWQKLGTCTVTGTNIINIPAINNGIQYTYTTNASVGTTWRYSIVLSGSGTVGIEIKRETGGGTFENITATITLTSTPTRYSLVYTIINTGQIGITVLIQRTTGQTATQAIATNAQLENATGQSNQNPSEYVSNGVLSAPYHGAGVDGVKYFNTLNGNTVSNNIVTETTGSSISNSTIKGIMVEAAATNLCVQSNDFTATGWVVTNITQSTDTTIAPDGSLAKKLTVTSTSSAALCQIFSNFQSTTIYCNVWMKKGSSATLGNSITVYNSITSTTLLLARVNLDTGVITYITGSTGVTVQSYPNGWWRVNYVVSSGITVGNNIIVYAGFGNSNETAGTYVYLYGQSVSTTNCSYIPTTTAAFTRNTETNYIQTTSNINSSKGTISFDFTPNHSPSGTIYLWGSYVDTSNRTSILHDGTNLIFRKIIAGVTYDAYKAFTFVQGTTYTIKAYWNTSGGINLTIDSIAGIGNSNTASLQLSSTMYIGSDGQGANQAFANFKNFTTSTNTVDLLSDAYKTILTDQSGNVVVDQSGNQITA